MNACARLHDVMQEKCKKKGFFSRKCILVNGERVIRDTEIKVNVHSKEIAQISATQSSREIGAHVTPSMT